MRVIAGKARRLILECCPGMETRPTTDRIKETLFNMINPYIGGAVFLDLFAGSGGIGIEALSRNARLAVFADNSSKSIECIKKNLKKTRLFENALVKHVDIVRNFYRIEADTSVPVCDIIYLDPPYDAGFEETVFKNLYKSRLCSKDTYVILESDIHKSLDFIENSGFELIRKKEYKTNMHLFCKRKLMLGEN